MLSEETANELNQLFGLDQALPARTRHDRWPCPVEAQEIGEFQIVPLTSSKALASEGWNMQHCVATYTAKCAEGFYQVFSIRNILGNRLATLGLTYGSRSWRVDQCLGSNNVEVLTKATEWIDENGKHCSMEEFTDLHYVAQEVTRLLNNQWKLL